MTRTAAPIRSLLLAPSLVAIAACAGSTASPSAGTPILATSAPAESPAGTAADASAMPASRDAIEAQAHTSLARLP